MKKAGLWMIAALMTVALGGCGGGNYSVLERVEGPLYIVYHVQVEAEMSHPEAHSIYTELEGKGEGKRTTVNFYDGPQDVGNRIYNCQSGICRDMQPDELHGEHRHH